MVLEGNSSAVDQFIDKASTELANATLHALINEEGDAHVGDGHHLSLDILAGELHHLEESMDEFFIVTMSIIIFFMQAGFAFMEAGAVRSKNTVNILIKNLLDALIGGIAYWLIGFPLQFGKGNAFMGYTYWASVGLPAHKFGHWFFDFVHAATASTLVSGSMAERCNFYAYLAYSFLITGVVYPIASHWTWAPNGWLKLTPYQDYAGGGVVHMTGGICALVGAWLMGPRIGRFHTKTGEAQDIRGHSVPLAALGGFILMFGFMAFAAGFQGHISQTGDGAIVARSIVNSLLGACGGGVGALIIHRAGTFGPCHSWSFLFTLNGALAGMVGVAAGANIFYPWAALVTGVGGGFIYLCLHFLLLKMQIDDPLDAAPVHFGGGFWGLLAVALLQPEGIFFTWSHKAAMVLVWNVAGAAAIGGWSAGLCLLMFGFFKWMDMLRVPRDMELRGMDLIKHNEPAYPTTAWEEAESGPMGTSAMASQLMNMMGSTSRKEGEATNPLMSTTEKKMAGPFRQMSSKRSIAMNH